MATHQTKLSAGADVCAAETVTILPNSYELIKTGEFVPDNMPDCCYLELLPRSSLCLKRWLDMPNSVGVIDKDYPGEILMPLRNLGDKPVTIEKGERIGQLICKTYYAKHTYRFIRRLMPIALADLGQRESKNE